MGAAAIGDDAGLILPGLRSDLSLHRGAPDDDGSPMWLLYDPLRHRYFHLHLRGLRLLRYWRPGASVQAFTQEARAQGIAVDDEDVDGMVRFVTTNDLIQSSGPPDTARLQAQRAQTQTRWWQWLLHRYLFFRIPLVRPDPFLERTLPRVRWLGGRGMRRAVVVLGLLGLFLAVRQWETFTGTFLHFLSWEGIVWYALALICVKIAHELGHAYTAKQRGCHIPTMGVAFLVMFPMPYTDATDIWRLPRRRDRLIIVIAGVATELTIALLATFAWGFLEPGAVRQAAFFLATTSWISSVLINLSPFMRFDGYHALSDLWGIHNLQPRAFDLTRWRLREWLFGFGVTPPEMFRPRRRRLLHAYAVGTWIYRLFLFLGIALLVYHFAFKLLGILLFAVEITFFILRPIVQELRAMGRHQWRWNRATRRTLIIGAGLIAVLLIPWRATIPLPAVLDAANQARIHTPEAARVAAVEVAAGDTVAAGDVLVRLEKPELANQADEARQRMALLRTRLERRAGSAGDLAAETVLRQQLAQQRVRLAGLRDRQRDLVIHSPIAGVVVRRADLQVGQWIAPDQLLAQIVAQDRARVIAYVREQARGRIRVGAQGRFIPNDGDHPATDLRVTAVEDVGSQRLPQRLLASTWGGPLPVQSDRDDGAPKLTEGVYRVRLEPATGTAVPAWRVAGRASVEAPAESPLGRFLRYAAAVLVRETGF